MSFLAIVQATKSGHFKGGQELAHNCDFLIKVVSGIAHHEGRFNTVSEIPIFSESLYQKNPIKKLAITTEPMAIIESKIKSNHSTLPVKKETILPSSITVELDDLITPEPRKQSPAIAVKKAFTSNPMHKNAAKWFLGVIAAIAIIEGMNRVEKMEDG